MNKTAVILFNLGGPDSLKTVKPFLFNLFNDAAIVQLPQPLRYVLAKWIAARRTKKARGIYQHLGGKSPIVEHTAAQAEALEKQLNANNEGDEYKTFICMRYWYPMSDVVVKKIKAYDPDRIVLLPMYPQFSVTTTGSSFSDWDRAAHKAALDIPTSRLCCYPGDFNFIAAHAKLIKDTYWKAAEHGQPRVLFSAHGLPEKIIAQGDPYQWQIQQTVATVTQILSIDQLDHSTCYQSRVGSLKWIGPSTEEEILRAGQDGRPVVVVPISFVSEHSETLVELDIEYRLLSEKYRVPSYHRVPALGVEPDFIDALAKLCIKTNGTQETCSFKKTRNCLESLNQCPCAT